MAALCYIMVFTSTKTYLDFEHALGMPGIVYLYGFVGVFGWLFFYFLLPETENRTLEDIETHFSTKSIMDLKIEKVCAPLNGVDDQQEKEKKAEGIDNVAFIESG